MRVLLLDIHENFEGVVELFVEVLRLHLLRYKVSHDAVDPQVELLHGFLSVLAAALRALQALKQDFDLKEGTFAPS